MADTSDAKNDFNPIELSIQAHDRGISSLSDRVAALEQNLKDPKLLAKTMEDAAEESTRLKRLFSKVFCDMMRNDDDVKTSIVQKMDEIDRVYWKRFRGKSGFAAWSIFLVVLTAIMTALADHYFKK